MAKEILDRAKIVELRIALIKWEMSADPTILRLIDPFIGELLARADAFEKIRQTFSDLLWPEPQELRLVEVAGIMSRVCTVMREYNALETEAKRVTQEQDESDHD
jgi:hypothetical protein